ncbi:MAG: RluA family pseudouridine synthase [Desulfobacteraceae bacterium]|nr:RluA family pseudouridine synthase [Desulfobacteraceae bacterium]
MPQNGKTIIHTVKPAENGMRLDIFLSSKISEQSRAYAAKLIKNGMVHIDGVAQKSSYKIKYCQEVRITIPPPKPLDLVPEPLDLNILYEDSDIIVLNKPPGLVVHPSAGHDSGTLVHGLLHHCPDLKGIGGEQRPGIVHRLDKDTSGILIVAKNHQVLKLLAGMFKSRQIKKHYLALVYGEPKNNSGVIDLPVGRHPVDRKKMAVLTHGGRQACTYWKVIQRYGKASLLSLDLKTGRTHQIRVHCKAIGHPLVGDSIYVLKKRLTEIANDKSPAGQALKNAGRQMLHAHILSFSHPLNKKMMHFEAPVPMDMKNFLQKLQNI